MEKYTETLKDLTWIELLREVSAILARDTKTLEANVSYYKKLLGESNSDKDQINRLFEKLQLDRLRLSYFSELFFRLDDTNYKFMIMHLESCIHQETQIQNRTPKDWAATVYFKNGEMQVYFMPLSYFQ
ncbi:MAG: hypothetical protein IPM51_06960 [Sphingobacteriaceae bacterium]|nr:hypothetical protein [Sphingobacteriaceae bacterium]